LLPEQSDNSKAGKLALLSRNLFLSDDCPGMNGCSYEGGIMIYCVINMAYKSMGINFNLSSRHNTRPGLDQVD